jgi:hypothetical protein
MDKIEAYLTKARDLYVIYTLDETWRYKYKFAASNTNAESIDCFNCGKKGHGVSDCKEPVDQARIDKNLLKEVIEDGGGKLPAEHGHGHGMIMVRNIKQLRPPRSDGM